MKTPREIARQVAIDLTCRRELHSAPNTIEVRCVRAGMLEALRWIVSLSFCGDTQVEAKIAELEAANV